MSRQELSARQGCAMAWISARGRLGDLYKSAIEKELPSESIKSSLELANQLVESFSRSNGGIAIMLRPFDELLVPKKKMKGLIRDFFVDTQINKDFNQEDLEDFGQHFYFLIVKTLNYLDNNYESLSDNRGEWITWSKYR